MIADVNKATILNVQYLSPGNINPGLSDRHSTAYLSNFENQPHTLFNKLPSNLFYLFKMYLIYCCGCLHKTVLLFSCHKYPRVMCELIFIQGETFFGHNAAPTVQGLVYLKIRNTTLTLTICVVQHQNKKFTAINISLISCMERSNFCPEWSNFCMKPLKVNKCCENIIYLSENTCKLYCD